MATTTIENKTTENNKSKSQLNPKAPEYIPTPYNFHHLQLPLYPYPYPYSYPPPPPYVLQYGCYLSPPRHPHPFLKTNKHKPRLLLPPPSTPSKGTIVVRKSRKKCNRRSPKPVVPPKNAYQLAVASPDPLPLACYPFGDSTSLMIRHIPVRFRRGELMEMLDEHCRQENEKIGPDSNEPFSEFDFLYLPIDFKRNGNYGYAFVNFTSWKGAARLYNAWTGLKWENNSCKFNSRKICEVSCAQLQGKKALKNKFARSVFKCDNEEYLPVEMTPARNGRNGNETSLVTIGARVRRSIAYV